MTSTGHLALQGTSTSLAQIEMTRSRFEGLGAPGQGLGANPLCQVFPQLRGVLNYGLQYVYVDCKVLHIDLHANVT